MVRMIRLAAWNWHMARRGQLLIALLLAAGQAGLLVFFALEPENALSHYSALFTGSFCPVLFAVAYCAAALMAQRPLLLGRGRSRAANTMLTLGMPRWQLLLAQSLSTVLPLVILIAWQLLLAAAFYWPVLALQGRWGTVAAAEAADTAGRFWFEFASNGLLRLLLPVTSQGWAALAAMLAAPAVLTPAVFLHAGWRRLPALAFLAAGALLCLGLAYNANQSICFMVNWVDWSVRISILLLVLLLVSWLWSLRALSRAEPAA